MAKIYRWKFLNKGLKSENGNLKWKIGKWETVDGKLNMCAWGLHCSREPYDAFSYVQGEILAKVECKGKSIIQDNKECWQSQRVVKAYKWTKKDSLRLAIFSAELVLPNFKKEYPDDKRPREAIEAAKKVLLKDTAKNRSIAESAGYAALSAAESAGYAVGSARSAAGYAALSAAESARYAVGSARYAAESAWYAVGSARSAAGYAAESAWYAMYGSGYAALSAAESAWYAAIKKIKTYFNKLVKNLK